MWGIKLTGFFTGIGGKLTDEIFIDKAQDIVVLPAIHGYILNEIKQIADGFCLLTLRATKVFQAILQGVKNTFKHFFVARRNQTVER